MGTRIESLAAYRSELADTPGSRDIASLVAWEVATCPVPLLVCSGIYRDGHEVEPAQAPYVQRALGNLAGSSGENPNGTFCFDVDRLLAAIEIADGGLRNRNLPCALVVCADTGLEYTAPRGLKVPASGGAMLLRAHDREGFQAFHSALFPEFAALHQAGVHWISDDERSHHSMVAVEEPGYLDACVDCAAAVLRSFLADVELAVTERMLIVPSQTPLHFPTALRERLGLPPGRVVDVTAGGKLPLLTSGPIAALEAARRDGRYAAAEHIVFVTVDPGIAVSAALYCKSPEVSS